LTPPVETPYLWSPKRKSWKNDVEENLSAQQSAPEAPSRISGAHGDEIGAGRAVPPPRARPQEALGLTPGSLPADAMDTLKTRAEFQRVHKGRKWVTQAFILQGLARTAEGAPRFGFTVSSKAVAKEGAAGKKRGKAVDRNRARRRLKEAVRLTCEENARAGFDYVVIGRASALTRNFMDLLADMRLAFHKVSQPARSDKERILLP
jgi:ribonuclease P protein component